MATVRTEMETRLALISVT